jgi:oligopeptide transport system substrate-binding protein
MLLSMLGCQPQNRNPGNVLRFDIETEPPSLDWSITTDDASIKVLNNLMEGLTRYDKDLKAVPAIAESWEVSPDGLKYLFHIRKNARWSDGKPVTAHDFVYSWQRLLNPDTAAEYAYFLYLVKNAREINSGRIKDLNALGARALDERTLEVELTHPAVYFPVVVTFVVTFPMRKDLVERYPDSWTEPEHIIVNGPFIPVSWHHEYKLVCEPNRYYWGGKPHLEQLVFYMVNESSTKLSLYDTGDFDIIRDPPPASIPTYRMLPDFKNRPYIGSYYIGLNVQKPPLNDARVRRALAMSIDRSKLPDILKGGQIPATSFIPPGMFGHNPDIGFKFDVKRARELLAEAGYPGGKGFPGITLAFNTLDQHQLICEYVQAQWHENLGIPVYLRNMEWKVYLKDLEMDPPQAFRFGWIADYPDPNNFAEIFLSASGNNNTRWKSKEYDDLVARGAVETDQAKRQAIYDQSQKLLLEDECAIVPLYFYAQNLLIKPYVKNLDINALQIFYFNTVSIDRSGK